MIRMTTAPSRLVLTLITLLALGLTDARAQPTACGSDIRRIEVNQTTLHYFECGKGEPLIFVHNATAICTAFETRCKRSPRASGSSPTAGVSPRPTLHYERQTSIL